MSKETYRYGYAGKRYTYAEMMKQRGWNMIHPEMRRRFKALLDDCPYDLGFGNGFRTAAEQGWSNDNSGGAPVGSSYHEATQPFGYGLACDFLNDDAPSIKWANAKAKEYGCYTLITLKEPWHFQPIEVPPAKRNYKPNVHTLKYWALPSVPLDVDYISPWPNPTLRIGSTGDAVKQLQTELTNWSKNPGPIDGKYGEQTATAVKAGQAESGAVVDGIFGPNTRTAFDTYYRSKGWGVVLAGS